MNDKPNWKVTQVGDIDRRGRAPTGARIPRDPRIGMNAFKPGEDGTLINEHDEVGSGQEELYIVLDGT